MKPTSEIGQKFCLGLSLRHFQECATINLADTHFFTLHTTFNIERNLVNQLRLLTRGIIFLVSHPSNIPTGRCLTSITEDVMVIAQQRLKMQG